MTQNNFDNPVTAGLWRNNPALVQLLGICPLLAVTTSLVNGLALGLATTFVILLTNFIVGLVRKWLLPAVRILIFVLIIASPRYRLLMLSLLPRFAIYLIRYMWILPGYILYQLMQQ